MTVFNEGVHAGEYLVAEVGGVAMCREVVTIKSGENLAAGVILGKVTADGKYIQVNTASVVGEEGAEVAAGILYDAVDASAGDVEAVITKRLTVVSAQVIAYPTGATQGEKDNINSELESLNIIVR